jgi:hypothetical protein
MPVKNIEKARTLIERWLNDRGYIVDATSPSENLEFQFSSSSNSGIGFAIIHPKNLKRVVIVATRITVDPFHVDALKSLEHESRSEFLWELQQSLLFFPPAFRIDNPSMPTSIDFTKEISFDELTEGKLHDAVDQTIRCVLYTAWLFNKKLGIPSVNTQ